MPIGTAAASSTLSSRSPVGPSCGGLLVWYLLAEHELPCLDSRPKSDYPRNLQFPFPTLSPFLFGSGTCHG
ncbi:hypothetical protein EJ02DRAFT_452943 [Clathrospora elynae]|uniref:Uncharacterized protein n=1 Tax=Clathrospora elynae TaxID=706981 RepID=A0A6A5T4A8_9PLEO|nr:hypothetical protein EJ02DRAFT_452943 [Clathrospora elynae]